MNSIKDLFNINPKYSTILADIIGILLTDNLSALEQDMLGNIILLIAQNIITNANSQYLIESKVLGNNININSKEVKSIYNPFIYNEERLKTIINEINKNDFIDLNIINNVLDELKQKLNKIKID